MTEADFIIRPMGMGDLDWVEKMQESTSEFNTGTDSAQSYSRRTLEGWIKNKNGVALMAEVKGKKAGFLLAEYKECSNDGEIHISAVIPEYRRQGIGAGLQIRAVDELATKGPEGHKCDHVVSWVEIDNEAMLALKAKVGFSYSEKRAFRCVEMMLPRKSKVL